MILKNCSLKQFEQMMQNKSIVCFGAGKCLYEFFDKTNIKYNIRFIVDNNEKLWNTVVNVNKQIIKIISLENAIKQILDDDILFITASIQAGDEIYKIIEKSGCFNKNIIYWSFFILYSNKTKKELLPKRNYQFKLTNNMMIPKIIHYCWFGKNLIPEEFQKYIAGWKEKCPDFEIIKWDETNYDVSKNQYMKQAYEAKAWGFVPDYARKDIIYEYGGIYLDTDVEVIKNLEDLLYQDGFCGFENFEKINFGLGFGAKKHLPIMKDLRDMYNNMEFKYNKRAEMLIGPDYETLKLKERGLKSDGTYQQVENLTVYPTDVLSGTNSFTDESLVTENTYTVHHYAGTWVDDEYRNNKDNLKSLCKNYMKQIRKI